MVVAVAGLGVRVKGAGEMEHGERGLSEGGQGIARIIPGQLLQGACKE